MNGFWQEAAGPCLCYGLFPRRDRYELGWMR
jgi:hypothetical protein